MKNYIRNQTLIPVGKIRSFFPPDIFQRNVTHMMHLIVIVKIFLEKK